ncbi:MAG: ClbS/DfsB family four-helix bundle protein [Anaerolineae bacterium]|nr:ClbS/DfsB family four-helix bundle protein [Anaerolineae bacterium]
MAEEMTRSRLLDQVRSGRAQFGALLDELDRAHMGTPGVQGAWSVKDIVAHVTAWEERMVAWLGQAAHGELDLPDWRGVDDMNEQTYQERKDWPLDEVMATFAQVGAQAIAAIEATPEPDLFAPGRFAGLGDGALWRLVAANTFEHYPAHIRAVRTWLADASPDPQVYYAWPGPMTAPRGYSWMLDGLPDGVKALVQVVQGLMLHIFWAERYGVSLSEERKGEVQLRQFAAQLARIRALDDRPLTEVRPPETRLVGNCRDFATVLCALLCHQGVPARARCGFGAYFTPGYYEDHWVCEVWKADEGRWALVDAQLDALQCEVLQIPFDPLDVPRDQFVVAGQAWQMCRRGDADPQRFGIFDMHGTWFVRGNLVRDMLALNKVEILPWDGGFGFLAEGEPRDAVADERTMDHLAILTTGGDATFGEVRALYAQDARLRVPVAWTAR